MSIAIGAFVLMATPLLLRPNVMFGIGGSLLGYLLPGIVLAKLAKKRQHKIQLGLADALDLMVVSVEAGLGLDQAIFAWATSCPLPIPTCRRAAAGEHRAARGQGPHRGASQPGRPDRPRGHRVTGDHADSDR
jgi:Flp pilus assembly protein TadB